MESNQPSQDSRIIHMKSTDISSTPNILIVEDDNISLFVLKKMLDRDYVVHSASNSQEAFQKIRETSIDLILMDINLGEDSLDGIKLMKEIRANDPYQNLPVFAITSYAMAQDKTNFLKEGFDAFLPKPVKKDDLNKALEKAFSSP